MRETSITLGGKKFTLRANFKAAKELADKVGDPLMISREGALEAMMLERGLTYEPKWKFNISNIVDILHIGATCYDFSVKREELEEAVFETGFYDARDMAIEYLGVLIGPKPDIATETKDADSSEK